MTGRTFSELVWPDGPDNIPTEWAKGVSEKVLDWTWRAFDALKKHTRNIDFSKPLEQLERDLVRHHFVEVQLLFAAESNGYSSIVPHHEWPELETRKAAPAKPPSYDMAFISTANQRWAWPIEAKVLPTAGTLAEYLKDVNDKFVGGVASPMIGEGAMMAYLLQQGSADTFFENLAVRLGQTLQKVPEFAERPHRGSNHARMRNPDLRLHHLAMVCEERSRGDIA